jgi:hypothetical protein
MCVQKEFFIPICGNLNFVSRAVDDTCITLRRLRGKAVDDCPSEKENKEFFHEYFSEKLNQDALKMV